MLASVASSVPKSLRVAVVQSNYIPWKGYFDLIRSVDLFVLYDDVQFTRRDWRNRNRIKTRAGVAWLTIPVQSKGNYFQTIRQTRIAQTHWADEHWETIRHNYAKASCFREVAEVLEPLYRSFAPAETWLSELNRRFIQEMCDFLGISTRITSSIDYDLTGDRSERLLGICRQAGASEYLSGPAARDYLDEPAFLREGVRVAWADYSGYPEYPQFFPPFEHGVSVIDLLFHTGREAGRYMQRSRGSSPLEDP
jgi:hypothetical protein